MFSRREFMKNTLLGSAVTFLLPSLSMAKPSRNSLIKPPSLKFGDTFGLVTPASPLFEEHHVLIEATEKLHNLGFKVKTGKNIFKKYGYLAGSVEERVSDLHDMFGDDEVKAIIAVRGGYGSAQLLPHLDYKFIARHPKILVGYSDITSLLIGIHQMTGLVTFHGPVAVSTFTDYTKKYFLKALMDTMPIGEIENAPYDENLQTSNRVWTYRSGIAEGHLIGGNMTLLESTLATPYEFNSKDAIIFFEDIGEEPYDLDRMLNHFKQAGKFKQCRGVFFGKMPDVKPADYKPAFNSSLSVEDIIHNVFKDFTFPVCMGISIGHIKEKPTLPEGIKAKLNAGKGRISLLEAAVS